MPESESSTDSYLSCALDIDRVPALLSALRMMQSQSRGCSIRRCQHDNEIDLDPYCD